MVVARAARGKFYRPTAKNVESFEGWRDRPYALPLTLSRMCHFCDTLQRTRIGTPEPRAFPGSLFA